MKNIAKSGIFQMQAERVCYHRRSRFAHHRFICNLIPSVYINSFSLNKEKPRDCSSGKYVLLFLCLKRKTGGLLPRSICSCVLMSKYGLCRRHLTVYQPRVSEAPRADTNPPIPTRPEWSHFSGIFQMLTRECFITGGRASLTTG